MKFIGLSTKDGVLQEKLKLFAAVSIIAALCILSIVGISTLLDIQTRAATEKRNSEMASILAETEASVSEASEETTETSECSETTETSDTSEAEAEETTEIQEETESSSETTETTSAWEESYYQAQVYAYGTLNVRSGPGTSYDIVLTLERGDAIDVIAVTDTGWYRTYNNNYVLAELCQSTPVTTTTAATQATTTARSTTRATTAATTAATTSSSSNSTNGMTYYGNCRITFYSASETGGNASTASGTTCSQGRTVAADWSIFPAGTVIYIANDPLGGDGYYTVEDRGSAVTGNTIDIYVDSISQSTTSADVYIVN